MPKIFFEHYTSTIRYKADRNNTTLIIADSRHDTCIVYIVLNRYDPEYVNDVIGMLHGVDSKYCIMIISGEHGYTMIPYLHYINDQIFDKLISIVKICDRWILYKMCRGKICRHGIDVKDVDKILQQVEKIINIVRQHVPASVNTSEVIDEVCNIVKSLLK